MNAVQITLSADNESIIDNIKYLLIQLKGVYNVHFAKVENEFDIRETPAYKEAMDDIEHGRVYKASNAKDMFKQILGENV